MHMIGSDFDGTIPCQKGKYIKESTRELIQAFRDRGNSFVIVTGRSPSSFQKAIQTYKVDFYDHLICANGAVIYDAKGTIIQKYSMDPQTVKELLISIYAIPVDVKCYINTEDTSILLEDCLSMENTKEVLSISLAFSSILDAKKFTGFHQRDCTSFLNGVYLDIMAKGVSKAAALLSVYEQKQSNVLHCIGDGVNDIPMLACGDHSYSFTYAEEKVRSHAAYICEEFDDVMKQILLECV